MSSKMIVNDSFGDVGDTYRSYLVTTDEYGIVTHSYTVTADVEYPDGTTDAATVTAESVTGFYLVTYSLTVAGKWTFTVTVTDGDGGGDKLSWTVLARDTSAGSRLPGVEDIGAYLGDHSYSDEEISSALEAETTAQFRACNVPSDYPPDLAEALRRRVARNLAARGVPIASYTSFEGGGTSQRVPLKDSEVVRLEAPYLRWVVA